MKDRQEKSQSLGYFNFARGLGMLAVLAGHSVSPFWQAAGAEQTHALFDGAGYVLGGGVMAMFFMISGFGFYRRSTKKCLSIQTKLLLRPYWLVAAAILVTKFLLALVKHRSFWKHGGELLLTYLLGLNAEGGATWGGIPIESISICWFLLALFGGWVIYNGIVQLPQKWLQWTLIAGCTLAGWLLTMVSKIWVFCIPMALLVVGYLAAGAEIRKHQLLERQLPVWCWGLLFLIVLLSAACGEVNIVACLWRRGLLDVAGSFCIGFLLLCLYARVMKRQPGGWLFSRIETVGFQSIWIVCIHAYEKNIVPWYRLSEIFPNAPVLCVLLCFVGRCVVIWLICLACSRVRQIWMRKRKRKAKIVIDW